MSCLSLTVLSTTMKSLTVLTHAHLKWWADDSFTGAVMSINHGCWKGQKSLIQMNSQENHWESMMLLRVTRGVGWTDTPYEQSTTLGSKATVANRGERSTFRFGQNLLSEQRITEICMGCSSKKRHVNCLRRCSIHSWWLKMWSYFSLRNTDKLYVA